MSSSPDDSGGERSRRTEALNDLLQSAIDSGRLTESDRDLLLDLAHAAEHLGAPGRRGCGGLMTPSVTQMVEDVHAMSSRSIRRHASEAITALREEADQAAVDLELSYEDWCDPGDG